MLLDFLWPMRRRMGGFVSLLMLLPLAGCAQMRGAHATASTPSEFTFSADGAWHESPAFAHSGEQWTFAPGAANPPEVQRALAVRIDQQTWPLDAARELRVETPGRISFRCDRTWLAEQPAPARVKLRRLSGRTGDNG